MNTIAAYKYLSKHPNRSVVIKDKVPNYLSGKIHVPHFQFNHSLIEMWEWNEIHRWQKVATYNFNMFMLMYRTKEFEINTYICK